MKTKYLILLLMAAIVGYVPATARDKNEKKDKTEQVAKGKKQEAKDKKGKGLFGKKKKQKGQEAQAPKDSAKVEKPSIDRKGLFHVTKVKNDWFFEIADSLLGREFLTTTRYTSTPSNSGKFGGEQVNGETLYFESAPDDRLLLRASLLINYADTTQKINRAITISNENPIIGSFKVESHKDGLYKIKVNDFFNQDNPAIGLSKSIKDGFGLQGQIGDASYIEDIKSFPMNTEVRLVKTFAAGGNSLITNRATGRATFGLNISFVLLPEKPMMRRYFDPRVGYFTDDYTSYSDSQQRVEEKRFITRWRLEPRPEDVEKMRRGELVEPVKPIVYYIDPATPKQWRKYLIQGVNDWQAAFEKAGFKNAIHAEEWPENDSTMSMEDARFSCIRYLASPIENAYGPNVHDPRTGEIIESHICWYHNVMSLVHDWYMVQCSSIDEAAQKMNYDEELMGQLIRFVSSHEVGHTLGLRHNFGSSSTVPVDSLRDKAWVEAHGHTPSIMDYARFNYVAQPEDGITHVGIFPRINDYDKWAIEWGYKAIPDALSAEDEQYVLKQEVSRRLDGNNRLWWGDGERGVNDPRCQTEDLSNDAIKASELGIENLKRILPQLADWNYWDTDVTSDKVRTMYGQVVNQYYRYMLHVANNLIGVYNTTSAPEQNTKMLQIPPVEKAKAVVPFLKAQLFEKPEWLVNVPYADRIFANPDDQLQSVANRILPSLISTYRIGQLNPNYGAANYLSDLKNAIFKDFNTSKPVDNYDRFLQRTFVNTLCSEYTSMRNSTANDALAAVLMTLKDLDRRLKNVSNADPVSEAHYAMLSDKLQRALIIK